MISQQWVDYIRTNMDKYPIEGLKAALIKGGATPEQAEEAVRLASAPPLSAPQPQIEPQHEPEGNPDFKTIIAIAKKVLFSPREFYRAMPKDGGYFPPLIFLAVMAATGLAIKVVLTIVFTVANVPGHASTGSFSVVIFGTIGMALASMIVIPIFTFIGAGIAMVIWKLLGSRENYETAFRCGAYTAAVMPFSLSLEIIPVIGFYAALAVLGYTTYLYIAASVEVHHVPQKRAVFAFGGLCLLMMLTMVGSRAALERAAKMQRAKMTPQPPGEIMQDAATPATRMQTTKTEGMVGHFTDTGALQQSGWEWVVRDIDSANLLLERNVRVRDRRTKRGQDETLYYYFVQSGDAGLLERLGFKRSEDPDQ
ncbi:MAG: YIP1 family protein [Elusimicrobiota bacterium]